MASERLKVLIATPCTDQVQATYCLDLAALYAHSRVAGLDCGYVQNRGTIIPQQRHMLVAGALDAGFTHILFVDSDMRFPRNALLRLLDRDVPIVATNYARRRHPVLPTAEFVIDGRRDVLFTSEDSEGLAEANVCGFGLILIRLDVFQTIKQPWFQIGYTPHDGQYVGEDFFFCKRARDAGFSILIDHDLSKEVKHTGAIDFTHAHAEQTRAHYAPKIELVTNGA